MIAIELNGDPRELPAGATLSGLIDSLAIGQQAVAVAVDREVVPRQRWPDYVLQAGQKVDIVRAIGGG